MTEEDSGLDAVAFPKEGQTNREWAHDLLRSLDSLKVDPNSDPVSLRDALDRRTSLLERALQIACLYSTRPSDRFAVEHVIPGHSIEALELRPGWIRAMCRTCFATIDLEKSSSVLLFEHVVNVNKETPQ